MSLIHAMLIIFAEAVTASAGVAGPAVELAPVISPSSIVQRITLEQRAAKSKSALKGWHYIAEKLIGVGIEERMVHAIYNNPQMPRFTKILFALKPKEGVHLYSELSTKSSAAAAKKCLSSHRGHFEAAESEYGVPREILAAVIFVESRCGAFTGKSAIIHRLSRLASVGDPENLVFNYNEHRRNNLSVTFGDTVERASYLEQTFFPQIKALIELAAMQKINVFGFRGSSAGAFGLPQFLPTNYFRYGIDGDRDGEVSLYTPADAIWSAANYLSDSGYNSELPFASNRSAIWSYNRSDAYIDAVIYLAEALSAE